jgi:hypothetical protein
MVPTDPAANLAGNIKKQNPIVDVQGMYFKISIHRYEMNNDK